MPHMQKSPLYVIPDRQQQQSSRTYPGDHKYQIQRQQYPLIDCQQQFSIEHQYPRVITPSAYSMHKQQQQRYLIEGGESVQGSSRKNFLYRQSQLPGPSTFRSEYLSQQQHIMSSSMQYNSMGHRMLTTKRPSSHYKILATTTANNNEILAGCAYSPLKVPLRVGMGISYGDKRVTFLKI